VTVSTLLAKTINSFLHLKLDLLEEKDILLTLHESQEDQRGQPRHRHGEEQDATTAEPVYSRPEQQPGTAPCAHRQQVRPIEARGCASDITSERAVTVTNAVSDESEGGRTKKTKMKQSCIYRRV